MAKLWRNSTDRFTPFYDGVEALVIFALIGLYVVLFKGRGPALAIGILAVLVSHWRHGEGPTQLGFRIRTTRFLLTLALALVALTASFLTGSTAIEPALGDSIAATLLTLFAGYVMWGLVQQWALNGFFNNRFVHAFSGFRLGRFYAAVLASLLFGAAHLPDAQLAVPATVFGFQSALLYQRYRDLPMLAVIHGTLGTILILSSSRQTLSIILECPL